MYVIILNSQYFLASPELSFTKAIDIIANADIKWKDKIKKGVRIIIREIKFILQNHWEKSIHLIKFISQTIHLFFSTTKIHSSLHHHYNITCETQIKRNMKLIIIPILLKKKVFTLNLKWIKDAFRIKNLESIHMKVPDQHGSQIPCSNLAKFFSLLSLSLYLQLCDFECVMEFWYLLCQVHSYSPSSILICTSS